MPIISFPIDEIEQSVSRVVIYSVIEKLKRQLFLPNSVPILFLGETQKRRQDGSDVTKQKEELPLLKTSTVLTIEVEQSTNKETMGTLASNSFEHRAVFRDNLLEVIINPFYVIDDITINLKYQSSSKTELYQILNNLISQINKAGDCYLHSLDYHYPIPNDIINLLKTIYTYRENIDPYQVTLEEYLSQCSTRRTKSISDSVGDKSRLVISETQTRVVGSFQFDTIPDKPEFNEETNMHILSIPYKFSYEKPVDFIAQYPILIHNQLLPREYIILNTTNPEEQYPRQRFSTSMFNLNHFEADVELFSHIDEVPIIRLPDFDDYSLPSMLFPGSSVILYALCQLDTETRTNLLNLNELSDLAFNGVILKFILESEAPFITSKYDSIFHLSLIQSGKLLSDNFLLFSSDGTLTSNYPLDLRKLYHVSLSIITDLSLLSPEALERLRLNPDVLLLIIEAINRSFINFPFNRENFRRRWVSREDFYWLIWYLTGRWPTLYREYINIDNTPLSHPNHPGSIFYGLNPVILRDFFRITNRKRTVMLSSIVSKRL